MNPISIVGAFIITIALLSYGIGSIAIQRFKLVTPWILFSITFGVMLDFTAIIFMIFGSSKGAFTPHSILGYSATVTMVIDMVLLWRCFIKNGNDSMISNSSILYSKIAYGWWLIVYLISSIMVIWPQN